MKGPKSRTGVSETGNSDMAGSETNGSENQSTSRPSEPGFSADEAKELLGMCVVANYLGPVVFPPFPVGLEPTAQSDNPLPDDDGRTYPYPAGRIWPAGWAPGVPTVDATRPWATSVLTSRLANGAPVNAAIVSYNAARNAYAIAFAGTLNPGAAMEDESALLVPAGPIDLPYLKSNENYISPFPVPAELPSGGIAYQPPAQPPQQIPMVHLGYRSAVNRWRWIVDAADAAVEILNNIRAMRSISTSPAIAWAPAAAQLFSAWVRAGGRCVEEDQRQVLQLRHARRAEHTDGFKLRAGLGGNRRTLLPRRELARYRSTTPPTKEVPADLINPAIAGDLSSRPCPSGLHTTSPLAPLVEAILGSRQKRGLPLPPPSRDLRRHRRGPDRCGDARWRASTISMDYVGMGVPHVLVAQYPVVYEAGTTPSYSVSCAPSVGSGHHPGRHDTPVVATLALPEFRQIPRGGIKDRGDDWTLLSAVDDRFMDDHPLEPL